MRILLWCPGFRLIPLTCTMLSVVVIDRRNPAVSTAHTAKYPPQFDHEHMSTEVGLSIVALLLLRCEERLKTTGCTGMRMVWYVRTSSSRSHVVDIT